MRKEYRILANFPAPCVSLAANRRAIPQRCNSFNYYNQIGATPFVCAWGVESSSVAWPT